MRERSSGSSARKLVAATSPLLLSERRLVHDDLVETVRTVGGLRGQVLCRRDQAPHRRVRGGGVVGADHLDLIVRAVGPDPEPHILAQRDVELFGHPGGDHRLGRTGGARAGREFDSVALTTMPADHGYADRVVPDLGPSVGHRERQRRWLVPRIQRRVGCPLRDRVQQVAGSRTASDPHAARAPARLSTPERPPTRPHEQGSQPRCSRTADRGPRRPWRRPPPAPPRPS